MSDGKTLRPDGVVLDGVLERGLEVDIEGGRVVAIRSTSRPSEPWVLSPAFVNAHSHLEYRGLLGAIEPGEFSQWIVELTRLKHSQNPDDVGRDCALAARENRSTGVALVWEHSDRPGSLGALDAVGIGGRLGQEVITLREHADPFEKVKSVAEKLKLESVGASGLRVGLTPHAAYTVSPSVLDSLARTEEFLSVHVAESVHERELFSNGAGPLADLYRAIGAPLPDRAPSVVAALARHGYLRSGVQFVHGCDLNDSDIDAIVDSGVTVAHCPRSNIALGCPQAPIRRLLGARVAVGLGLDSAASSGEVDMFIEMRTTLNVSAQLGEPLGPGDVWRMATGLGAASIFHPDPWEIAEGAVVPLIAIALDTQAAPVTLRDVIDRSAPSSVSWISTNSGQS